MSVKLIAHKAVAVKDLPVGRAKAHLLARVESVKTNIQIVLANVNGSVNAYHGYPNYTALRKVARTPDMEYNCTMIRTPEQVAKMGNKLSKSEAVELFPDFSKRISS